MRLRIKSLAFAAAIAGALPAAPVIAQDSDPVFEEIVVRAQRRDENIMTVPVAVTSVTGAEIDASGIRDVFELQQNVPSLIVGQSQSTTTSNFQIRSVGSTSNNFGVESSVGLYVDEVYRSRQSSMINELIDVKAVDVLRGPQGTLFGKNTAAGAIAIRTNRPGDGRSFIEASAGDHGFGRIAAAGDFDMGGSVGARATVFYSQRDGYVDDINFGSDKLNDRDRYGIRLQLANTDSGANFNWRIIGDYSKIDEVCCVALSRIDNLYSRASISGIPTPGSDALVLAFGGTVFTDFPYPQPLLDALAPLPGTIVTGTGFDAYTTALNELPSSENDDSGLSAELSWNLDNGMTLTSVSAYRSFNTKDRIDADFTDVPLLIRINDAEQDSFSQEFRLDGTFGANDSKFVLGAYYFTQEITNLKTTSDPGLLSAYFAQDPQLVAIAAGVNAVAAQAGPPYQPAGAIALPGNVAVDDTTHEQDGYAVFAQFDFALTPSFIATIGGRYTDETKDTVATYTQSLPANQPRPDFGLMGILLCSLDAACAATLPPGLPSFDPVASFPVFQPFFVDGWGTFAFDPLAPRSDINESIKDDQTTGTFKLTWLASDSAMLYASYSTGFKSGGINDDRINPAFSQSFGAETSESAEIGFKGDLGERVRVGIAIYDAKFEDFQANAFTGTGFNLQNAGDLETQGFEVEFAWRPTNTFEISGFYARNEGEFKSFVEGTCWDATPFHTGVPDPGLPPAFNPLLALERCDRTGGKLPYNPEDRFFLAADHQIPIGNNGIFWRLEYSYASEALTDGDLDPFTESDELNIINARIGYSWIDWDADLTLWGRNITDEKYFAGSFDAPAQTGRMNSYPQQPAMYGITFRKGFD